MADSRELAAVVGQNGANHGIEDGGVLRVRERKLIDHIFCYKMKFIIVSW